MVKNGTQANKPSPIPFKSFILFRLVQLKKTSANQKISNQSYHRSKYHEIRFCEFKLNDHVRVNGSKTKQQGMRDLELSFEQLGGFKRKGPRRTTRMGLLVFDPPPTQLLGAHTQTLAYVRKASTLHPFRRGRVVVASLFGAGVIPVEIRKAGI